MELDGILGGYSLYILQLLPGRGRGCVLGKLRSELRKESKSFSLGGGVFWVSSDLNSGKKVRVFHFGGGVFWVSSDLNSGKKFTVFHWVGFWVRSDLDSGNNFNFGGGGVLEPNSRTGVFWRIWSKISGNLAGWCITDSLSHTTYVETNETY